MADRLRDLSPPPKGTGVVTREGVPYCAALGYRCLGHRQAAEMVANARRLGYRSARVYHCDRCSSWHYDKGAASKAKPGRAKRVARAKRRQW